ncbi:hypothetical protein GCM10027037_21960 [Mucilaginibacter koreensis]
MRKVIALVLLSIQLYTIGGYLALRQYLVHRSEQFFNAEVAKNRYYIPDLFEVKIPVNLPGIHDWDAYEHISGQIHFRDNVYNYVQMRMTSHYLYLKCVPNYKTTRFSEDNILRADPIKDIPAPKKHHVPEAGIFMMAAYTVHQPHVAVLPPVIIESAQQIAGAPPVHSGELKTIKQPPQLIS